ncbi:amidohydrolase family protein [Actinophytocola oryzae]|uniref:Imidazolonepropionase-like amidohydrolase n=1 Tax=Actinophytocola oryzae TaxID=502181 RepID=A0A4R7VS96_9PSEU|nr:amidohydrolase family protein [Actinophytocola oryzae]TDV52097.1 imidazolonepropionase-like amidohydrolase [Actinophytocola oryzae]
MSLTLLRAARVFDGTRVIANPTVVIDGGRVVATGVELPDAEVVELGDVTLLPGMIDVHVHLAFDGGPDPVAALVARTPDEVHDSMVDAARRTLRRGVTTVRDLGDLNFSSLELRGRPDLPTIVAAGPPVTTEGGHCHFLGGATTGTEASVRAAVRRRVERGCDVVKIMASGGTLTAGSAQHEPQFGVAELRAAVDEAHRHGLPVVAHAHASAGIANALAAGVDGLEHVSFWSADGVDDRPDLLELITERRAAVGASIGMAPPSPSSGVRPPPEVVARVPRIMAAYRRLIEAGAVVVAGTDAGIGPPKRHPSLPNAVPQLVGLGMTPLEALRAVTSVAAEVCGLAGRKGRLAPGYDADLVAVAGDPVTDPAAVHDVRAVYLGGRLVE